MPRRRTTITAMLLVASLALGACSKSGDIERTTDESAAPAEDASSADPQQTIDAFGQAFLGGALGSDTSTRIDFGGNASASEWSERQDTLAISYSRSKEKIRDDALIAEFFEETGAAPVDGWRDGNWEAAIYPTAAAAGEALADRIATMSGSTDVGSEVTLWECGPECANSGDVGFELFWQSGAVVFALPLEFDDDSDITGDDIDFATIAAHLRSISGPVEG